MFILRPRPRTIPYRTADGERKIYSDLHPQTYRHGKKEDREDGEDREDRERRET